MEIPRDRNRQAFSRLVTQRQTEFDIHIWAFGLEFSSPEAARAIIFIQLVKVLVGG